MCFTCIASVSPGTALLCLSSLNSDTSSTATSNVMHTHAGCRLCKPAQVWVKELPNLRCLQNLLGSLHCLSHYASAIPCCMTTGGGVRGSASSIALDGLASAGLGPQSHLLSWADRAFGPGLTTITKGQDQHHIVHQHSSSAQQFMCLWPAIVSDAVDSYLSSPR